MSNARPGIGHRGPSSPARLFPASFACIMASLPQTNFTILRRSPVPLQQNSLQRFHATLPSVYHVAQNSSPFTRLAVCSSGRCLFVLVCAFGGPAPSDATYRPMAAPRSQHKLRLGGPQACPNLLQYGCLSWKHAMSGQPALVVGSMVAANVWVLWH